MCLTKYPLDIASDQLSSAMAYIAAIRALCISYLGSLEMRWSFAIAITGHLPNHIMTTMKPNSSPCEYQNPHHPVSIDTLLSML